MRIHSCHGFPDAAWWWSPSFPHNSFAISSIKAENLEIKRRKIASAFAFRGNGRYVTKTRCPQMTGDDRPLPGISTFHLTFFVLLHSVGGFSLDSRPITSRSTPMAPIGSLGQ